MDGSITSKTLSFRFLALTDTLAGAGLGVTRTGSDRFQEISSGSIIPSARVNVAIRAITNEGYLEIAIVKIQRSTIVPAVGTSPSPTSLQVDGQGLESAMREQYPGWCIHNIVMPFSAETPTQRNFSVNLTKFKMAKFRDGDHLLLAIFNRSASTVTVDHKANYYEYK